MKIKIMIQDYEVLKGQSQAEASVRQTHTCIWEGEVELLKDNVYVTKISILAEGEPQPICDIPFSPTVGWYMWVPPTEYREDMPEIALVDPRRVIRADIVSPYPPELTRAPITLEDSSQLEDMKVDDE